MEGEEGRRVRGLARIIVPFGSVLVPFSEWSQPRPPCRGPGPVEVGDGLEGADLGLLEAAPWGLWRFHEKASPVKRGATGRPDGGLRAPRPLPARARDGMAPSVPRAVRPVRPSSVSRGRVGSPWWGSKWATPAEKEVLGL